MSPATLFSIVNVLPLPIWALWILAPRSAVSRALVRSLWPWQVLAVIYLVCLVVALGFEKPGAPDFGSLAGVMALFDTEWGTLAGWVHYLCFDLFVGRFVMNDAPEGGYRLAPVLFLTLMFGPVGLLLYTTARGFFRGAAAA